MFVWKSSMFHQCCIKASPEKTVNESSMKHQCFRDLPTKHINDLQCLHRIHQCFNVASILHRCLFTEKACFLMSKVENYQCYKCFFNWVPQRRLIEEESTAQQRCQEKQMTIKNREYSFSAKEMEKIL